jgi:hypothetical protein
MKNRVGNIKPKLPVKSFNFEFDSPKPNKTENCNLNFKTPFQKSTPLNNIRSIDSSHKFRKMYIGR